MKLTFDINHIRKFQDGRQKSEMIIAPIDNSSTSVEFRFEDRRMYQVEIDNSELMVLHKQIGEYLKGK